MKNDAVLIRAALLKDMRRCAAIFNQWLDATTWMPRVHDHDDVVRHYREGIYGTDDVMVAEKADIVGAFMALSPHGVITALYIDPDFRGAGIGTALIDKAKHKCSDGLSLWTFVANEGARRFYQREGFVEVRRTEGDNEEGLPDILFHWQPRNVQ